MFLHSARSLLQTVRVFFRIFQIVLKVFLFPIWSVLPSFSTSETSVLNLEKFVYEARIDGYETCNKLPCFKFSFEKAECTEKDRILEIDVYNFSIEVKCCNLNNDKIIELLRYVNAIDNMLQNEKMPDNILDVKIIKLEKNFATLEIKTE